MSNQEPNESPQSASVRPSRRSINLGVLCLFVLGIAGLCVWAYVTKQAECLGVYASPVVDGANANRRVPVVKARKAVTEGSTIRAEDLIVEPMLLREAPNALHSIDDAVDCTALKDIGAGQPVKFVDIIQPTKIVVSTKDLAKGTVVSASDLKVEKIKRSATDPPVFNMIEDVADVAGRVLTRNITAGEQIKSEDLDLPSTKSK